MDRMTCTMDLVGDTPLVSVTGELDPRTAPQLRAVLRKADAEQPTAVVIDIERMRPDTALSLLALLPPVEHTERWQAPRLLCVPSPYLRTLLAENSQTRGLPTYPTRAEALAAARHTVAERVVRDLPASPAAPSQARLLLAEACGRWHLPEVVAAGQLIISELCANVVVHVGAAMTVVLLRTPTSLHIVVRDPDRTPPVAGPPMQGSTIPAGRGLRLVEKVASGWGYTPLPTGKAVWALLRHTGAAES
jgi:hypothetical protein